MEIVCINCGKPFEIPKSYLNRKYPIKNCSIECSRQWRKGKSWLTDNGRKILSEKKKGENNPNWIGGKPKCLICGEICSRRGVQYCWDCLVESGTLRELVPNGENHYRWVPDEILRKYAKIRGSSTYKKWRNGIVESIGKCEWCGSMKNLELDHIKPYALYPDLVMEDSNARVLCKRCHKTTDTYGGKIGRYKNDG